MLCIQPPSSQSSNSDHAPPKLTPNILPCRITHFGPVNASKQYWDVESDDKGRKVAYFRGRKLLGREVRVHKDYRGVIVRRTDRVLPQSSLINTTKIDPNRLAAAAQDEEEESEDEAEPVKVLEEIGSFDEVVVWGHEQVPAADDVFVRGVEEWIQFAEAIHRVDDREAEAKG